VEIKAYLSLIGSRNAVALRPRVLTAWCGAAAHLAKKSMTGQCRGQDNVASLRVLVSKQDLLFIVATRPAICDIILSATLSYHALYSTVLAPSKNYPKTGIKILEYGNTPAIV